MEGKNYSNEEETDWHKELIRFWNNVQSVTEEKAITKILEKWGS